MNEELELKIQKNKEKVYSTLENAKLYKYKGVVSKLLGLTENDDPVKVEFDLMKVLPKEQWILFNIQAIAHGRKVCIARRPKCAECVLREVCKSAAKVKQ